jgi:hypothetical protein
MKEQKVFTNPFGEVVYQSFSMDRVEGNSVWEKSFISDLQEFTPEERKVLLNGGEVYSYTTDKGEDVYVSIHQDEED